MKIYVLDTDIVGFVRNEHPTVMARFQAALNEGYVVTTIITFGENLEGWLPACRRAANGAARTQAYGKLSEGLDYYREKTCLPFDEKAAQIFDFLKAQKIRTGTNDLAIAAITLAVNGILVTRNHVDFARVPNLILEDWTT